MVAWRCHHVARVDNDMRQSGQKQCSTRERGEQVASFPAPVSRSMFVGLAWLRFSVRGQLLLPGWHQLEHRHREDQVAHVRALVGALLFHLEAIHGRRARYQVRPTCVVGWRGHMRDCRSATPQRLKADRERELPLHAPHTKVDKTIDTYKYPISALNRFPLEVYHRHQSAFDKEQRCRVLEAGGGACLTEAAG